MSNLAQIASDQGDYPSAKKYLARALSRAHELGYVRGAAIALSRLAMVAAAEGELERAAILSGAADRLYAQTNIGQGNSALRQFQAMKQRVREQFDEEPFEIAWQTGRAWPLKHVIAFAVDGVEQEPTTPDVEAR